MAEGRDNEHVGAGEENMFQDQNMHQAPVGESPNLLKLLSLPISLLSGKDPNDFHYFRESYLKYVRIGNLSNAEATSLLQHYVQGYAYTVLKRYMAVIPREDWQVTTALDVVRDTIFPASITQTGVGQIYSLEQRRDEPIQQFVERISTIANSLVRGYGENKEVADAVRHALLFNTLPRYRSYLTNPAVSDYDARRLLDYAATLDRVRDATTRDEKDDTLRAMQDMMTMFMNMTMEMMRHQLQQVPYEWPGNYPTQHIQPQPQICWYCNEPGHRRDQCRSRKEDLKLVEQAQSSRSKEQKTKKKNRFGRQSAK